MSTFKLEVGGTCKNGAEVVALFKDSNHGVVLAEYHNEYVTWLFHPDMQDSTAHGNYFGSNTELALDEAKADFIERVTKYI
jgi:hypothetical protein